MSSTNTSWSEDSKTKASATLTTSISDIDIPATSKLYLDGGGNTYITETSSDVLDIYVGGVQMLTSSASTFVINEGSVDADFRVESNGNANMLFVDGGGDRVGIGTAAPLRTLSVYASGTSAIQLCNDAGAASNGSPTATEGALIYYAADDLVILNQDTSGGHIKIAVDNDVTKGIFIQENTGKVGIGTSSPDGMLDIESSANTDNVPYLYITNLSDTADHQGGNIVFRRGDPSANLTDGDVIGDIWFSGQDNSDDAWITAGGIRVDIDGTPDTNVMPGEMSFWINNDGDNVSRIMTIKKTGRLGIGESSPEGSLHIVDGTSVGVTPDANAHTLILDSTTEPMGMTLLTANGGKQQINFGDAADVDIGRIEYDHDDNDMIFWTSAAEKMRIDKNGNVGIGSNNPSQKLTVSTAAGSGDCYVRVEANSGSDAGISLVNESTVKWTVKNEGSNDHFYIYDHSDSSTAVELEDGATDWTSESDSRLKKDVTNIGSILSSIDSLTPITYKKKYGKLDKTHAGLIAQDVKSHFPLLVTGSEDSFEEITDEDTGDVTSSGGLGIMYASFVPYLIKAIQELSAKVEALENK